LGKFTHEKYLEEVDECVIRLTINTFDELARLRSNMAFHKKYPMAGNLVEKHLPEFGLLKHDRLIAGADLADIHGLNDVDLLPIRVVFFRGSSAELHLTNLSVFIAVPGIHPNIAF
jgi:hypothetical protein